MNVLLVTGSRSLADNREAERAVSYWFSDLNPLSVDLVVAGGSHGPDTWAELEARTSSIPYERWQLDGRVVESKYTYSDRRWYPESEPPAGPKRLPLERNAAMVQSVAKRALCGANVLCMGFVDPKSRTKGTDHTLRLARQAGIWTARYAWTGASFEERS